MELNQERIESGVIAEVANNLTNETDLSKLVAREVTKRLDAIFVATANEQISKAINEAIENGFHREYQKTTSWGEAAGSPTSISKELERLIGGYWNQKVDAKGKLSESVYSGVTRAEWFMTELAAKDFEGQMKQHLVNISGALKDSLRENMHVTVNKMLSEILHVKSLDDAKLKETGRACIDPVARKIEDATP